MAVAIVTGSGGLVGAEAARFLAHKGFEVVGIDNDLRDRFFGEAASTRPMSAALQREIPSYHHVEADIRDADALDRLFSRYGRRIELVIHAAAQPSHDWAASAPAVDFAVNATGTLNLLETTRRHSQTAVFAFCSSNKVYGDTPNRLPLQERETRWEIAEAHPFAEHGIDESMSMDQSLHSLFGVSKCSADLLVQEYGGYFGMRTACFRCGCITGPGHAGAEQHGFLAYLVKCAVTGQPYTILGYGGKQVRDNIHSADLVSAFWHFFMRPGVAEVYNMGGGRFSCCSVIEAIGMIEAQSGRPMRTSYQPANRPGDHIWWISDVRRFANHYPQWRLTRTTEAIIGEIHAHLTADRGGFRCAER
ncbi:MAG TPA: NAD-dependent epimerase/dehydratase family protein [Rhodopila sp.]|nr:NAD-dependent epimerase/dehydratase family protein [Rhodopila sp.]